MNTWIRALQMYNAGHPATRWIMPVIGGNIYKEVKEIQANEKPEAKRAKALTGLRKVEEETKARNVARETKAKEEKAKEAEKPKSAEKKPTNAVAERIRKDYEGYKNTIQKTDITGTTEASIGRRDIVVNARRWIENARKQLKEPKNKAILDALKDSDIMTYKIPKKVMDLKLSEYETDEEDEKKKSEEVEEEDEMIYGLDADKILGITLTAPEQKIIDTLRKCLQSKLVPDSIMIDDSCDVKKAQFSTKVEETMNFHKVAKMMNVTRDDLENAAYKGSYMTPADDAYKLRLKIIKKGKELGIKPIGGQKKVGDKFVDIV